MAGRKDPAVLAQIDTDPSYKRVAKAIEEAITSGRLRPGDLLPTETDLAQQLGVNRSTVREGIRALENSDLIKRAGGKRLIVSVPEQSGIAWVNTRALGLMNVSFLDLWTVQLELEPFAAEQAARDVTPDLVAALERNLADLRENLSDDRRVIANDIAFHHLVARASGNPVLDMVSAPIRVLLFSATTDLYQAVPQARHRLLAAHEAIVAEIAAGNVAAARAWMHRHIADFRRGYEVAGYDLEAPIPFDTQAIEGCFAPLE